MDNTRSFTLTTRTHGALTDNYRNESLTWDQAVSLIESWMDRLAIRDSAPVLLSRHDELESYGDNDDFIEAYGRAVFDNESENQWHVTGDTYSSGWYATEPEAEAAYLAAMRQQWSDTFAEAIEITEEEGEPI